MSSVLFVSIAFPPKSDAEGLQVAKCFKYLRKICPRPLDVVTSALPTLNMPYDADLLPAAEGVRQLVALRLFENRYLNYLLRRFLPGLLCAPDPKLTFHLQAPLVGWRLREKPSLIYSRAFPTSSAVLALKLKRYYQVPWVMHLSDLWADCPEARYQGAIMGRQQKLERSCFEAADAICLTSRKTLAFYQKKYAHLASRLHFFPNVFDPEDIRPPEPPKEIAKKIRIVHTGSLAGDRSPEPFLQALQRLSREQQDQLEVIFAGPADRRNLALFKQYPFDCLTYKGMVPYREALALQRSADVLLLIDMPVEPVDRRVFFPSKLLDYMITGRPILGLIDPDSEVARFLGERGDTAIPRSHTEEVADFLLQLVAARAAGDTARFVGKPPQAEFDAAYNADRLNSLFETLLTSTPHQPR